MTMLVGRSPAGEHLPADGSVVHLELLLLLVDGGSVPLSGLLERLDVLGGAGL